MSDTPKDQRTLDFAISRRYKRIDDIRQTFIEKASADLMEEAQDVIRLQKDLLSKMSLMEYDEAIAHWSKVRSLDAELRALHKKAHLFTARV